MGTVTPTHPWGGMLFKFLVEDTEFLISGFTEGFMLQYRGPHETRLASNLKSGLNNLEVLWGKILAEVRKGRYVGPFVNPPFKNTICCPMGLVPKRDEASNDLSLLKPDSLDSWRLITHLSSPKGQSVNSFIPPEYTKVKYESFDRAIKLCKKEGKGCYLGKLLNASKYLASCITSTIF
jgi:hypothetical protein